MKRQSSRPPTHFPPALGRRTAALALALGLSLGVTACEQPTAVETDPDAAQIIPVLPDMTLVGDPPRPATSVEEVYILYTAGIWLFEGGYLDVPQTIALLTPVVNAYTQLVVDDRHDLVALSLQQVSVQAQALVDGGALPQETADFFIQAVDNAVLQLIATVEVAPPGPLTLTSIGAIQLLSATARDGGGEEVEGLTFEWISDDPSVAEVVADGTVTAVSSGSAVITASVSGVAGNAVTVTVTVGSPISLLGQWDVVGSDIVSWTALLEFTEQEAQGPDFLVEGFFVWQEVDGNRHGTELFRGTLFADRSLLISGYQLIDATGIVLGDYAGAVSGDGNTIDGTWLPSSGVWTATRR